ncbi:MAG: DUF6438 domain-containing protein [Chloroflexota bacterium]|nr:DUF6438 domain-containing protein [Chloroflexota bacterium]
MKVNQRQVYLLLFVVALALVAGALVNSGPFGNRDSSLPAPLPTVDMAQARQAFDSGGSLSYADIVALQNDIVGSPPDLRQMTDTKAYPDLYNDYLARIEPFSEQLAKCRLKESLGWLASYREALDDDGTPLPRVLQACVAMLDPYSVPDAVADEYPAICLHLTDMGEEQIAELQTGRQIRFSGDLAGTRIHPITVENVKYELLPDEFVSPTVSPAELENFEVSLSRSMCLGACPDYTVFVNGRGEVTFQGRYYTRVTGTATTTIDQDKVAEIVREIHRADFFSLDNDYSAEVTDLPTYTLSVQFGRRSKTVSAYGAGPLKLHILESRIDQILNTQQWIK